MIQVPPDEQWVDQQAVLERGRACCARRAWSDARAALTRADQASSIGAEDLELLALSAYMTGDDEAYATVLERAHQARLQAGEGRRAARCAFWLGLRLAFRGEMGPAAGWFARAQRLVDGEGNDCAERGWLLLPIAEQALASGDADAAFAAATHAGSTGERCGDPDLCACARHLQGRIRLQQGQLNEGLALLDEAMVAVVAGELSPVVTGLVYCSVIDACQQIHDSARAREWTAALTRWCDAQPQMVAFTGVCMVHRAEILQCVGAWDEAIAEARRAFERLLQSRNRNGVAAACYRQGEIHRLRGAFAEAEAAFCKASEFGLDPQPGYALLRHAQGRTAAAAAAIRRALAAAGDRPERVALLPAQVEILLAGGEVDEAAACCTELETIAAAFGPGVVAAAASQARGALLLAQGETGAALRPLRAARQSWQELEVPYEAAKARVLTALACRALGDRDGARLELEGARTTFDRLGAAPDVAHAHALEREALQSHAQRLTRRELQVLRLVAVGRTNKSIAAELGLSERTIDRHLSHILGKLEVRSRAAATARAYQLALI
jgi:DNA-binding CsgD family transcriptional regulator